MKPQQRPHAVIVEAEDFSQAYRYVQEQAQELLQTNNLEICPDYRVISPEGKANKIKIEAIRDLINDVQKSPQNAPEKVFVIEQADMLNKNAADAFLKTLEEPPSNTYFFLITDAKNHLLPTIISRCAWHRLPSTPFVLPPEIESWLQAFRDFSQKDFSGDVFELQRLLNTLTAALKNIEDSRSVLQDRILREMEHCLNALLGHVPAIKIQRLMDTLHQARVMLNLNGTFAQAMEFILLEFVSLSSVA